jgi:glutaryl-CoA dehydrogenase (non-decarboxylating)
MNFELPEEVELLRKSARRFAEEVIRPNQLEDEKSHRFRPEWVRQMGELGFFGTVIPEEYGGVEMDHGFLAAAVVSMELARVSASWSLPVNMQMLGPALTILRFGNAEQKEKYLPKLVAGEWLGCFAMTEPNTGSDVASMKTHADRQADGSFVVNGQKTWISNAHVADCGLLYAYTDRDASPKHRGMSAFIIEPKQMEGIQAVPIEEKFGLFCSPTGELIFEDAKLPQTALFGEEGKGFKICMSQLDGTRLSCAARAVGLGQACLEAAVEYANDRKQFGRPIADFQMVQSQIAEMYAEHEAAELLVYRAALKRDAGERATRETSVAKYFAAEAAVHAANETMKIFGSYGYSDEYPAGRLLRDAKSYQIVEGTSNVQKMIISGYALGRRS